MTEDQDLQKPFTPFKNIALCLSGGGFRAAAFSLGTLSYLNRIKLAGSPLLNRVIYISSTSGGTITNLLYSSHLCKYNNEKEAFYRCFKKLKEEMAGERLLEKAVENLAGESLWEGNQVTKQRNVINAFSKAYDEILFNRETFSIFFNKKEDRDLSVCFNTTEFTRGISFRFQLDKSNSIFKLVGNKYTYFDEGSAETLGRIKLGDILAASSCFPAGFEPILYPGDFAHEQLTEKELSDSMILEDYNCQTASLTGSIAFMDGGVTDNQALYSAMNADDRRVNNKNNPRVPFDLFIITDVTSYFMEPYSPKKDKSYFWSEDTVGGYLKKLSIVHSAMKGFIYGVIGLLVIAFVCLFFQPWPWTHATGLIVLGAGLLGAALLGVVFLITGKSAVLNNLIFHPEKISLEAIVQAEHVEDDYQRTVINKLLHFIETVKLKTLYKMILARVQSVTTMAMDVNLKQVRRLIFSLFYQNNKWQNRRMPNFIYELSNQHKVERLSRFSDPGQPAHILSPQDKSIITYVSPAIEKLASEAKNMGTTMWFDKKDDGNNMLDKIIQCGQFTTCINLLEYTMILLTLQEKNELSLDEQIIADLQNLKKSLIDDWNEFNKNPDFLFQVELAFLKTNSYK
jgi:predicted acylesterase/phospholipase RssA